MSQEEKEQGTQEYAGGECSPNEYYAGECAAEATPEAAAKEGLRNLAQRLSMEQMVEAKKRADAFNLNPASAKSR